MSLDAGAGAGWGPDWRPDAAWSSLVSTCLHNIAAAGAAVGTDFLLHDDILSLSEVKLKSNFKAIAIKCKGKEVMSDVILACWVDYGSKHDIDIINIYKVKGCSIY